MSNFQNDYSDSVKIAHIKGKYKVACAILALVGGIIGALGGSKLGPIDINIHSDDYVGTAGQEMISQQESTIANLQTSYDELQKQNTALKEENQALQANLDTALAELASISNSQTQSSATSNAMPIQAAGTVTKLTALPLLGNNEDYYNHIYNNAENSEYARSNLGDVFNSSISLRENGNVDFFLDGKYQALTFTLCIAEETRDIDDYSSYIEIYSVEGNGETESTTLLYTSPSVTMGFIPESIGPVNVTGVNHLRITFFRPDTSPYNVPRIILGNPELT